jgi:hypothetical protein
MEEIGIKKRVVITIDECKRANTDRTTAIFYISTSSFPDSLSSAACCEVGERGGVGYHCIGGTGLESISSTHSYEYIHT